MLAQNEGRMLRLGQLIAAIGMHQRDAKTSNEAYDCSKIPQVKYREAYQEVAEHRNIEKADIKEVVCAIIIIYQLIVSVQKDFCIRKVLFQI